MNYLVTKEKNIINGIKGIILIGLYLSTTYLQVFYKDLLKIGKPSNSEIVLLSFLSTLTFLIFIVFIYRKDLKKEFTIYKNNFENNIDTGIKYWLIGLFFMMISNILIGILFKSGMANNEQKVQSMINAFPVLMVLNAGFMAPIIEEILFRKCFRDTFNNNYLFILISGIFFGYMHVAGFNNIAQATYIIPYSSLGICFALMYVKSKTIFTSISMHMFHNTLLTILSILI